MQHITNDDLAVLEDLVPTLEDGREGFTIVAESLEESGRIDLADRMREFGSERALMSEELRRLAADHGEEIEPNGSAAGAAHRGWISVKDALTGDDPHGMLAAAEEGEDHAVKVYEEALERADLTSSLRALVADQAARVRETHDQVRALRDSLD